MMAARAPQYAVYCLPPIAYFAVVPLRTADRRFPRTAGGLAAAPVIAFSIADTSSV
jgi:hypothetical protein